MHLAHHLAPTLATLLLLALLFPDTCYMEVYRLPTATGSQTLDLREVQILDKNGLALTSAQVTLTSNGGTLTNPASCTDGNIPRQNAGGPFCKYATTVTDTPPLGVLTFKFACSNGLTGSTFYTAKGAGQNPSSGILSYGVRLYWRSTPATLFSFGGAPAQWSYTFTTGSLV